MSFKRIKPLNAGIMKKPSMYRACVRGDKAEYWACEKLLMAAYKRRMKMDKMREEFQRLFNEFAGKYDQFGDEWQDMTVEEVFIQGCIASRQALVVQLPLWRHYNGVQAYDISEVKQSIDDSGIKWKS